MCSKWNFRACMDFFVSSLITQFSLLITHRSSLKIPQLPTPHPFGHCFQFSSLKYFNLFVGPYLSWVLDPFIFSNFFILSFFLTLHNGASSLFSDQASSLFSTITPTTSSSRNRGTLQKKPNSTPNSDRFKQPTPSALFLDFFYGSKMRKAKGKKKIEWMNWDEKGEKEGKKIRKKERKNELRWERQKGRKKKGKKDQTEEKKKKRERVKSCGWWVPWCSVI